MTSEKEKMIAGELYLPGDPELVADRQRAQELMHAYNKTVIGDPSRKGLLKELLGSGSETAALRYVKPRQQRARHLSDDATRVQRQ